MTQDNKHEFLLAIPCYNCAPQIGRVLDKITPELQEQVEEIMVIDNRSTDDLGQKVLDYIASGKLEKLHLYRNCENYSLGGSHKIAFLKAESMGLTHVIILHGDDQADPADIPSMISLIESGTCSTVLGSRFNKDSKLVGYDWKRIAGNRALNVVYTILTGKHVEDLGSGLNIFAVADMDQSRYLNFADRLTFNFELLLDLIDRKVNFVYCPITWREEDQTSNARNFRVGWTALKNVAHWRFARKSFFKTGKTAKDYVTVEVVE